MRELPRRLACTKHRPSIMWQEVVVLEEALQPDWGRPGLDMPLASAALVV